MELDHVFIFTESAAQVAEALCGFGLTEGAPNTHPGQGTSCRRFFFQNAYLELVWVSNEQEIRSRRVARTLLWERSQYQKTGFCPFGICCRDSHKVNEENRLLFEDGWQYRPSFFPGDVYANIASNHSFPLEPMLFEIPSFGLAPEDYPSEKQQPLDHARGFKEITKIIITIPGSPGRLSPSMKKVIESGIVDLLPGNDFLLTVEFDNDVKGEQHDFKPLLPLMIRW